MTYSIYQTTGSSVELTLENEYSSTAGSVLKQDRVIFSYLFTTQDRLKEQNKKLFLFLNSNLIEGNLRVINSFVNDCAIRDLHLSLLKSALIMTESHDGIETQFLKEIYESKRNHY